MVETSKGDHRLLHVKVKVGSPPKSLTKGSEEKGGMGALQWGVKVLLQEGFSEVNRKGTVEGRPEA